MIIYIVSILFYIILKCFKKMFQVIHDVHIMCSIWIILDYTFPKFFIRNTIPILYRSSLSKQPQLFVAWIPQNVKNIPLRFCSMLILLHHAISANFSAARPKEFYWIQTRWLGRWMKSIVMFMGKGCTCSAMTINIHHIQCTFTEHFIR